MIATRASSLVAPAFLLPSPCERSERWGGVGGGGLLLAGAVAPHPVLRFARTTLPTASRGEGR
jgi:hypothetical protein